MTGSGARWIGVLAAASLAAGCGIGANVRAPVTAYDFGPPPAIATPGTPARALTVHEVVAPGWMESTALVYRLGYRDAAQTHAYANSRWAMPPGALLGTRLRQRLAGSLTVLRPDSGIRTELALRVELDEFSHLFDAPERSRALVRMRVTLIGPRGAAVQRAFAIERAAASADAEGGARALAAASDEAIEQLIAWVATNLRN